MKKRNKRTKAKEKRVDLWIEKQIHFSMILRPLKPNDNSSMN